jgi:cell division protein ZapA
MIVNKVISIQIMGKEYQIACPAHKAPQLLAAAALVNNKMQAIKNAGKIIGNEKIAIMVALNIADDFLATQDESVDHNTQLHTKLEMLCDKVEKVLEPT